MNSRILSIIILAIILSLFAYGLAQAAPPRECHSLRCTLFVEEPAERIKRTVPRTLDIGTLEPVTTPVFIPATPTPD